jgi:hypothetical protein
VICAYAGEAVVYRFSCGCDWRVEQDSVHDTAQDAKAAAMQLYGVPLDAWRSGTTAGEP